MGKLHSTGIGLIERLESRMLLSIVTGIAGTETPSKATAVVVEPTIPISTATGTVSGVVKDPSGNAVAGAFVLLVRRPGVTLDSGSNSPADFVLPSNAQTDANGQFTLTQVPVGSYIGTSGKKGVGFATFTATVTADQTSTLTIQLKAIPTPQPAATGAVTGTVTDSNGAVVPVAVVYLVPQFAVPISSSAAAGDLATAVDWVGNILNFQATTDANGNYQINSVPAGSYTARVFDSSSGSGQTDLLVTKDQTTTANITLQPLPTIDIGSVTGTVKDASGNAISGASVTLVRRPTPVPLGSATGSSGSDGAQTGSAIVPFPRPTPIQQTTTDAQGAFDLAKVAVGTYTLTVNETGFAPDQEIVTVTKDQATTVTVTLSPAAAPAQGEGTVKGTINDASGAMVAGALVLLVPDPGAFVAGSATSTLMPVIPTTQLQHTITDGSGSFELDNIPAGNYMVFAGKRGSGFARVSVTVTDGQIATLAITLSTGEAPVIPVKAVNTLIAQTRKAQAQAARAAKRAARLAQKNAAKSQSS